MHLKRRFEIVVKPTLAVFVTLGLSAVLLSGCASKDAPAPTAPVNTAPVITAVNILPASVTLTAAGASQSINATVTTTTGIAQAAAVTWTSSDPAIATVSGSGLAAIVTAVANGSAVIRATSGGKDGTANVLVNIPPPAVVSVSVTPPNVSFNRVGTTANLAATVTTTAGIAASPVVVWASSNPAVATVAASGTSATVTSVASGNALITATSGGFSDTTVVQVSLPAPVAVVTISAAPAYMITGQAVQLTATLRTADGTIVTDRAVSWTTSSALSATVSNSGLVTAIAPYDSVRVTATSEGKSATTATIVYASPLVPIPNTGSNPGNIIFYEGGPAIAKPHALVMILHGCNMIAAQMESTSWTELAYRHGFTVMYLETGGGACFQFYDSLQTRRDRGQALSIVNGVKWAVANRNIDPSRVFITGFSGGAIMTANMIASYPEVFAGASIVEGAPARCADVFALTCNFPIDRTPAAWGDLVRQMAGHPGGPYPRVTIWQGDIDNVVLPENATELMEQWTNLHGIDQTADVTTSVGRATRLEFRASQGNTKVETWMISGLGHGIPVAPAEKCGYSLPWSFDVGVCYTDWSARFFGLKQ